MKHGTDPLVPTAPAPPQVPLARVAPTIARARRATYGAVAGAFLAVAPSSGSACGSGIDTGGDDAATGGVAADAAADARPVTRADAGGSTSSDSSASVAPVALDATVSVDASAGGGPSPTADSGRQGIDSGRARDAGTSVDATGGGLADTGGSTSANGPALPAIDGACPTFATGTVTVGGLSGIALQVGSKSSGTAPLLFYWHGTGSTSAEVDSLVPSAVRQEILSDGGIIVSFQGSLGSGGDCSGTGTFSKDDFKVADQIAACAVRDYGVDPRRIYTTGCSAGGLQAGCMGALRSSYVAAAVPNSGGEVVDEPIEDPSHVPSVMTMHGGSQDMVVVSFTQTSDTYDTQMKAAGAFAVDCDHGGGHCGAPAALYTAGWQFMKDHPFGVKPEPYASGLPASFPTYCMPF